MHSATTPQRSSCHSVHTHAIVCISKCETRVPIGFGTGSLGTGLGIGSRIGLVPTTKKQGTYRVGGRLTG